jgi:hypothetical protein
LKSDARTSVAIASTAYSTGRRTALQRASATMATKKGLNSADSV